MRLASQRDKGRKQADPNARNGGSRGGGATQTKSRRRGGGKEEEEDVTHYYATTRDGRAHPRMRATHTGAGDRQAQGQDGQTSRPGAGGAPSSHCCRKECGWLAKGTRDGNRRTPMRGMGEVGAEVRRRRKAADGEGERAPLPREVHSPQASRAVGHKSSEGASNQAKQSRRGVGNKDGSGREGGGAGWSTRGKNVGIGEGRGMEPQH